MSKLKLNESQIKSCRLSASRIAADVMNFGKSRSTVSIERTILRLLGVSGADETEVPFVNRLVSDLAERNLLLRFPR